MHEHLYRYRPIDAVLDGYHELENQEIYFSTPAELNDPLERFKDLFWSGDRIVWRNLLRHYILCLIEITVCAFIAGAEFDEQTLENIISMAPERLPDAPIRSIYARISEAFLADESVGDFVEYVLTQPTPVRAIELKSHLRTLHGFAVQLMFNELVERGLQPEPLRNAAPPLGQLRKRIKLIMGGVQKLPGMKDFRDRFASTMAFVSENTSAQMNLILEYNHRDPEKIGLLFALMHYPAAYVDALEKLVHQAWYVACFTTSATNSSMWSNYAQGHRGVCLKFRTTPNAQGEPTFTISQVNAAGGSREGTRYFYGNVAHPLYKLTYDGNFPPIDFFRSLGTIPHSSVDGFWYRGEDGTLSTCREAFANDQKAWHSRYWQTFIASALCKTSTFAHEEEYRLVLHSMFDMRAKEKRKLKYRFEDLTGIVFGAQTTRADKLKIMRIIDRKCSEFGRTDFEFTQITYHEAERRFVEMPLKLLRVAPRAEPGAAA
jgi:hypothetical protein